MKFLLLLCALALTPCLAQENLEADFLRLLQPDVPNAPPPTLSESTAVLEKWKLHESQQQAKLSNNISEARKLVVELLVKKALNAPPAQRSQITAEAERIRSLKSEVPLTFVQGKDLAHYNALIGAWKDKDNTRFDPEFLPDGGTKHSKGKMGTWRWIDGASGTSAFANEIAWQNGPGLMQAMSTTWRRYTLAKVGTVSAPSMDPLIVNLNAEEETQRLAMQDALGKLRGKVIAWLLDRAKRLPANESIDFLQGIRALEIAADEAGGSASKLAGTWRWDRPEIVFQPYGIVTSKSGQRLGRWNWIHEKMDFIGVVLNGGKTTSDVFMAVAPTTPTQTTIEVHRLSSGHFDATRTLP